jgi:hypothetical protein
MSWKIQINSRCDVIATDHLRRQATPALLVPMLPASRVSLAINKRTITSKVATQLRHIGGSSSPYTNNKSQVQHLCRIHNWTLGQLHQIDWSIFHSTTNQKSSFPNRLFKIRWVNHILPLHHRQFRFKLSPAADCPSNCGCDAETDSHLLLCPHPERRGIYATSHKALLATGRQHHADPWLNQILASVLARYDPSIRFNLAGLTPPYRALVTAQTALGHASLFYGFFHQSWLTLQDDYLRTLGHPRDRHQARHLIVLWAHQFQAMARAQWDARNHHLHDSTPDAQPYVHQLLLARTRNIYSLSDLLLFHDRAAVYHDIPLADRLQFSSSRLKNWISHVTPIIKISLRQAKDRPPGNRDIRDFFTFPRPPEADPL